MSKLLAEIIIHKVYDDGIFYDNPDSIKENPKKPSSDLSEMDLE